MLPASRALGKGQLQEAAVSPMLSGTPTPPSGAGTAETGTQSLTFPSPASFPGFVTLNSLLINLYLVVSLTWCWGNRRRAGDQGVTLTRGRVTPMLGT